MNKIEEILSKYDATFPDGWTEVDRECVVKELSTLISQAEKEAVEGFADLLSRGEIIRVGGVMNGDIPVFIKEETKMFRKAIKKVLKTYLSSIGKDK